MIFNNMNHVMRFVFVRYLFTFLGKMKFREAMSHYMVELENLLTPTYIYLKFRL